MLYVIISIIAVFINLVTKSHEQVGLAVSTLHICCTESPGLVSTGFRHRMIIGTLTGVGGRGVGDSISLNRPD